MRWKIWKKGAGNTRQIFCVGQAQNAWIVSVRCKCKTVQTGSWKDSCRAAVQKDRVQQFPRVLLPKYRVFVRRFAFAIHPEERWEDTKSMHCVKVHLSWDQPAGDRTVCSRFSSPPQFVLAAVFFTRAHRQFISAPTKCSYIGCWHERNEK